MALAIKDTPSLKGKDARLFMHQISRSSEKKYSKEYIAKLQESYEIMKSLEVKSK
jgi:hypothetical protein